MSLASPDVGCWLRPRKKVNHEMTSTGAPATVESQAKHKITFSPTDTVFRDVVEQIVEAVNAGNLEDPNPHPIAAVMAVGRMHVGGKGARSVYETRDLLVI
jgi:hypothetical protein